jgi:hypothetical protein
LKEVIAYIVKNINTLKRKKATWRLAQPAFLIILFIYIYIIHCSSQIW